MEIKPRSYLEPCDEICGVQLIYCYVLLLLRPLSTLNTRSIIKSKESMSCNGCRILRKRCSERCTLRSSLHWIHSPQAQAHATLFLAKFFGRSHLVYSISSVPQHNRPALFQSLLFEACGRTINPVNGAVGLLLTGNWHVCEAAVETVLAGGVLRPLPELVAPTTLEESSESMLLSELQPMASIEECLKRRSDATAVADSSLVWRVSEMASYDACSGKNEKKLLNLFV
ncbi:unnamed protein product [Sphenostylis stenocarpa]|uniref:LOB domain-containing protein n=1 Tax=Sphenostylis stenocarpa TaxID=92480 RepID=A0AA86TBT3_9FABA|nr:unnamed protein product [Sphenostylis stenocarpa]